MTSFFRKKYIKTPICVLIIFSFIFQFVPSPKPVQAGVIGSLIDKVRTIFSRIEIPNKVLYSEKGSVKVGNLLCLSGDEKGCFLPCIHKENGECVNFFSYLDLGIDLRTDILAENGREFLKPDIKSPPECQLGIPLSPLEDPLTQEQHKAQRIACTNLGRLQNVAANVAFLAKRIYNNTDPFTECNFLKNCKSSCTLQLGEISYVISIVDVAIAFLPGGFLTVLQKILNIIKIINQVKDMWQTLKKLLTDGIGFVNNILTITSSLVNFYESFTNLGLKFSDALIAGAGAVVVGELGSRIGGGIGGGKGEDIGSMIGMAVGAGVATKVFNEERAEQGSDNLSNLLSNYAVYNEKFVIAKTEALKLNSQISNNIEVIRNKLKHESEIEFLFNSQLSRKQDLEKMLGDYSAVFETIDSFIGDVLAMGTLKDGSVITELSPGGIKESPFSCAANGGALYAPLFDEYFSCVPDSNSICVMPERVLLQTKCDLTIPAIAGSILDIEGCNWLDAFKQVCERAQDLKYLFDIEFNEEIMKLYHSDDYWNDSAFQEVKTMFIEKFGQEYFEEIGGDHYHETMHKTYKYWISQLDLWYNIAFREDNPDYEDPEDAFFGEIDKMRNDIGMLSLRNHGLKLTYEAEPIKKFRPTPYWTDAFWCGENIKETEDDMNETFIESYDSDVAFQNWEDKINNVVLSDSKFYDLKKALEMQLSPKDPLIVFTIEKAKEDLIYAVDQADTLLENFKKVIGELIISYGQQATEALEKHNQYINICNTCLDQCGVDEDSCILRLESDCRGDCTDYCNDVCKPEAEAQEIDNGYCYDDKEDCKDDCDDVDDAYKDYCLHELADNRSICEDNLCENIGKCSRFNDYTIYLLCKDYYQDNMYECNKELLSLERCNIENARGACWCKDEWFNEYEEFSELQKAYTEYLENLDVVSFDKLKEELPIVLDESFDDIKNSFENIFEVWNKEQETVAKTESEAVREYVQNIIITKQETKYISERALPEFKTNFSPLEVLMRAALETMGDVDTPIRVKKTHIDMFKEMLDLSSPSLVEAFDAIQREIVLYLEKKIGQYDSSEYAKIDDEGNIVTTPDGKVETVSGCPEISMSNDLFLNKLKCFEDERIERTFEELIKFLDVLRSFERTAELSSEAFDNIEELNPEIKMAPLKIDTGIVNETETALTGCLKFWDNKAGCDIKKPFQDLFVGQGEDEENWEHVKGNIISTPLSFLADVFNNIKYAVNTSRNNHLVTATSSLKTIFKGDDRVDQYQNDIIDIREDFRILWWEKIGDESNNLRSACDALDIVFKTDPVDIKEMCINTVDKDILSDRSLNEKCQVLAGIDIDVLQEIIDEPDSIQKRIESIEESRKCITEENCAGEKDACIECPKWFCLDESLTIWGFCNNQSGCTTDSYCNEIFNDGGTGLYNNIIWDTSLTIAERQWPPKSKCVGQEAKYADKYLGAQTLCIQTQKDLRNLNDFQDFLDNELGGVAAIPALQDQCDELDYHQSLQRQCDDFAELRGAFKCGDKVWSIEKEKCGNKSDQVKEISKDLRELCEENIAADEFQCKSTLGVDLTDPNTDNKEAVVARIKAERVCRQNLNDIRTPLTELMKFWSIITGIQSGNSAYGGLKNVASEAKTLYKNAQALISMIKNFGKVFGELWEGDEETNTEAGLLGGLVFGYPRCVSGPAVSYTNGRKSTSLQGGNVCPNIDSFFNSLDSHFSATRRYLKTIDQSRRYLGTWKSSDNATLKLELDVQPIDEKLNEVVEVMYNRAKVIKTKAQIVWAVANAVNMASQQCTCGQSVCDITVKKIPFCVSGLPLTLAPLTNPYCSLVWMLRWPLLVLAESLEAELERPWGTLGNEPDQYKRVLDKE